MICFGKVIVEVKAVSALTDEHRAQLMNYLRATGLKVWLLINFSHYPGVEHEEEMAKPGPRSFSHSACSAYSVVVAALSQVLCSNASEME